MRGLNVVFRDLGLGVLMVVGVVVCLFVGVSLSLIVVLRVVCYVCLVDFKLTSLRCENDDFAFVALLLNDFGFVSIVLGVFGEPDYGELLGVAALVLFDSVISLQRFDPGVSPPSVRFGWWVYLSGISNLFKLVGADFGIVLFFAFCFITSVRVLLVRNFVAVAMISGGSMLAFVVSFLVVMLVVSGLVVSLGFFVAVGYGAGDALAAEYGTLWCKTVVVSMGVPPARHDSSDGICLTGGGSAAKMAFSSFSGDVINLFGFGM